MNKHMKTFLNYMLIFIGVLGLVDLTLLAMGIKLIFNASYYGGLIVGSISTFVIFYKDK